MKKNKVKNRQDKKIAKVKLPREMLRPVSIEELSRIYRGLLEA